MDEEILKLLGRADYAPANVPELLRLLRWPPNRQQQLQELLRRLEQSGRITRTKGNRYIQSREADLVPGRIRINRQGKGFLIPDDSGLKEIMVPESATSTALHEDRVLVRRDVKPRGPRADDLTQETGTVIRILERKRTQVVGTLQRSPRFLYVIPDDPRMPHDIYVPAPRDVGRPANVGDKVVVELHGVGIAPIKSFRGRNHRSAGTRRMKKAWTCFSGAETSTRRLLHFPKNVLQEARAIGTTVQPGELAGREDCRSHAVVTIDPDDAKDFDDAICLQRQARGEMEALGAHCRRLELRKARHRAGRRSDARIAEIPLTWWIVSSRCCRKH